MRARVAGEEEKSPALQAADAPQVRHRIGSRNPLRHLHNHGTLLPKLHHQGGKRADSQKHCIAHVHELTLGLDRAARNRAEVTQARKMVIAASNQRTPKLLAVSSWR